MKETTRRSKAGCKMDVRVDLWHPMNITLRQKFANSWWILQALFVIPKFITREHSYGNINNYSCHSRGFKNGRNEEHIWSQYGLKRAPWTAISFYSYFVFRHLSAFFHKINNVQEGATFTTVDATVIILLPRMNVRRKNELLCQHDGSLDNTIQ